MKQLILTTLILLLMGSNTYGADLLIFSGAGLIKPMEELRINFEQQHQVTVDAHYGSSGEIFSMVAAGQPCDVLIPGAEKYTQDALKNGWVMKETIRKLTLHVPVIAVPKGNPAGVTGLESLTRPGIKVAIGDPNAPAIGRVAKKMLTRANMWEGVAPNIQVMAPTVNQLLIYVALKQVDAAIIWADLTAWAKDKGKVETVAIENRFNMIKTIPTAVCVNGKNPDTARAFNAYIASPQGMTIWQKWGFEPCSD